MEYRLEGSGPTVTKETKKVHRRITKDAFQGKTPEEKTMDKTLINQLHDSAPQKRRAASYKMGKSKDIGYVPYLIQVYDDTDAIVRQNVLDALRLLGTDQAKEFLGADAAGKARIKSEIASATPAASGDSPIAAYLKALTLDRNGLNSLLERIRNSSPEEQALLSSEMTKLFGEKALDWWGALATDRETILSKSMSRLTIPTPPPGNLAGRMAVAGTIGLLTGNMNAGVHAASLAASLDGFLLNGKINIPTVCNLCGVNEGTHFKAIEKEVVFSELGNAIGGSLMGKVKVSLNIPVCARCANLKMAPGIFLESYEKAEKGWNLTLQIANSAVADQYAKMNQGVQVRETVAQMVAAEEAKEPEAQPQAAEQEGQHPGSIEIFRKAKMTGAMYPVAISLDGKKVGSVKGNETFQFRAAPGAHSLHVEGGGLKKTISINITEDQHLKFQTEFSDMGLLGGGLKLETVPPGK
jgi:hypothetical protein